MHCNLFIYGDFAVTLTKKIIQNNLPILSTQLLKRDVNQISQSLRGIQHYDRVSPQRDLSDPSLQGLGQFSARVIFYNQLDNLQKIIGPKPPPRPIKSKSLVISIDNTNKSNFTGTQLPKLEKRGFTRKHGEENKTQQIQATFSRSLV